MRLREKVAVITGAANGIGHAMALRFAREGASVVIADKDAEHGKQTATEIQKNGGSALYRHCDVSRENDISAVLSAARDHFGLWIFLSMTRPGSSTNPCWKPPQKSSPRLWLSM